MEFLNVNASHLLTLLVFAPTLGALLMCVLRGDERPEVNSALRNSYHARLRWFAGVVTLVTFALSILVLWVFDSSSASMQLVESYAWIPSFGVTYTIGVDGISLFLIVLTTFLMPLVVVTSRSVKQNLKGYLVNMLFLETAMLGTFVALDVFLFYVFWELMLFPMYFLIGIWGGKRRIYATMKFVLYTVVGSLLMLVALLATVWLYYSQTGEVSFLLPDLLSTRFLLSVECWLFAAFALAFAVKVPIFPFHTWLPDAHVEAPTGGSVILAGVLLKMGLYGFMRFAYPLFPRAAELFAPYIATLAVIGIVYGALVAWAQTDIKKLVAYSSVSHLGYCVLGFVAFNAVSTSGSIYQMLNHGISTGALFILVGVLYDRKHTREIAAYGGLTKVVPVFAFLFLVFTLSSIALPLTNGFVGEFLILLGSFQTFEKHTMVAVLGVILGAAYMLTLYLKTMFGELDQEKNGDLEDVRPHELVALVPLLVLVFYMGIFPQSILRTMEPSVNAMIAGVEERHRSLNTYEGVSGSAMARLGTQRISVFNTDAKPLLLSH